MLKGLKGVGSENGQVAQDRYHWWALVNVVMNIQILYKQRLSINWITV